MSNILGYTNIDGMSVKPIPYSECIVLIDVLGELAALLLDMVVDKKLMQQDIDYLERVVSIYNLDNLNTILSGYKKIVSSKDYTLDSMLLYDTMCNRKIMINMLEKSA